MKTNISKAMLSKASLSKDIVNKMRSDIIVGKYSTGTRLREKDIADSYDVSRGTVRSALQELSSEGLIEFLESGGCIVVGIDEKIIQDTYMFRQLLELQAAEIILERNDLSYVPLADVLSKYSQNEESIHQRSEDVSYYIDADMQFHMAFVEAAGNRPIYRAWCSLAPVIKTLLSINLNKDYLERFSSKFYENHKAILDYAILHDRRLIDEIKGQMKSGMEMCLQNIRQLKR